MYDPLVVDTFIHVYPQIAPQAISAGQEVRSLIESPAAPTASSQAMAPTSLAQIRSNAFESAILEQHGRDLTMAGSITSSVQVTAQCLRQITPATVYALFEYDGAADQLTCRHSAGDEQRLIDGLTIKLGERVTGWSGANRRGSVNSDASLDLAQIATLFLPPLRSTICTPLVQDDRLVGILTAYSSTASAFNQNHQYAFELASLALLSKISSLQSSAASRVVAFPAHRA